MLIKYCSRCQTEKEFWPSSKSWCKACLLEKQRERRKLGDNTTYRYRYGKTSKELNELRMMQGNKCAICNIDFTNSFHTVVDHCHKTNSFRGFLCRKCNVGIGMFNDDPKLLKNALEYLTCL